MVLFHLFSARYDINSPPHSSLMPKQVSYTNQLLCTLCRPPHNLSAPFSSFRCFQSRRDSLLPLIQRYTTPVNAANTFAKRAQSLVGQEMLAAASLDRAQAFFLCSIWNWGSGFRDRSWIFLGIAARMASVLRLSQEESFDLGPDATVEQIINAEVSRRTWWVIFMSDNLLSSGCGRPISFDLDKVTIPLPCDEDHFTFGYNGPATVMEGTHARPRLAPQSRFPIDPQLSSEIADTSSTNANGGDRSLYGNLVIIADIWARVARGALLRS